MTTSAASGANENALPKIDHFYPSDVHFYFKSINDGHKYHRTTKSHRKAANGTANNAKAGIKF